MAKFLSNIKSLFIVEEETSGSQPGKSTPTPDTRSGEASPRPTPGTGTTSSNNVSTPAAPTGKAEADQRFLDVLFSAMQQNNVEGFDYLEYKQSLNSLEKMPMDEATRYKSAFAMAQTLGGTVPGLLQTANHYISVLGKEEQKFEEALNNQRQKQIGNKQEQIKALEGEIQAKARQIELLTKEISAGQESMKKMQAEITEATQSVEVTKASFLASYEFLVNKIKYDAQRIQEFLGTQTK